MTQPYLGATPSGQRVSGVGGTDGVVLDARGWSVNTIPPVTTGAPTMARFVVLRPGTSQSRIAWSRWTEAFGNDPEGGWGVGVNLNYQPTCFLYDGLGTRQYLTGPALDPMKLAVVGFQLRDFEWRMFVNETEVDIASPFLSGMFPTSGTQHGDVTQIGEIPALVPPGRGGELYMLAGCDLLTADVPVSALVAEMVGALEQGRKVDTSVWGDIQWLWDGRDAFEEPVWIDQVSGVELDPYPLGGFGAQAPGTAYFPARF